MPYDERKGIWFGFWILIVGSFILGAIYLLLFAHGYRLNFRAKKIQQTGMIVLASDPKDVKVSLDGKEVARKTPEVSRFILPGNHEVILEKEGYHTWQKTFTLEPNQADIEEDIILFVKGPSQEVSGDQDLKKRLESNSDSDQNVQVKDNELWYKGSFVTRFASPIVKALTYSDENHFLVQIGDQLHVIDKDGSNDVELLKFPKSDPLPWILLSNGRRFAYLVDQEVHVFKIR